MKIYSVYDNASQSYGMLWISHNDVTAIRTFSMEVNNDVPNNMLRATPDDFNLIELGTFDQQTGELVAGTRKTIINARKVLKQEEK